MKLMCLRIAMCVIVLVTACAHEQTTAASPDPCAKEREDLKAEQERSALARALLGGQPRAGQLLYLCEARAGDAARADKKATEKLQTEDAGWQWRTSAEYRAKIFSARLCYVRALREIKRRVAAGETDGLDKGIHVLPDERDLVASENRTLHVLELNRTAAVACDVDFIPELTICELQYSWLLVRRPEIWEPCAHADVRTRMEQYDQGPKVFLDAEQETKDKKLDPKSLLSPHSGQ